ncbi:MAG: nuclear transport factor 2 family protein [Mycolicibacterium neoaurum]|uniref:limonene-1,2-epoxide hydrolase family protein n=1 Tax=Mycolicibacterium neoaurum TaxID=1795 RepID=UPI002FFC4B14
MSDLDSEAKNPADVVEGYLSALEQGDFDTAYMLLADDVVFHNVGLPVLRGRDRTVGLFRKMMRWIRFEAVIDHIAVEGSCVLTLRRDVMILGPLRLRFWVWGIFEVREGRIALWREYFDYFAMFRTTWRAVAGLVIPSLR